MNRLFPSIVAITLLLASPITLAEKQGGGGVFSGSVNVTGPINTSSTAGYQQYGSTILTTLGTQAVPPYGTCTNTCSTKVGFGAGANTLTNEYLLTAVGWNAAGAMNAANTESTALGWNSLGQVTGSSGLYFLTGIGVNVMGGSGCASGCTHSTGLGTDAGRDATLLTNVTLLGEASGLTGNYTNSVMAGKDAGRWNATATGGVNLIGIGNSALFGSAATTAKDLIAVGTGSLQNVTSANQGVAIGTSAGQTSTTDSNFVFIGWKSATASVGSVSSTCVGYFTCGGTGFSASNDVVIGATAGSLLTSGGNNTLIGKDSGLIMTTGGGNVCVGKSSCSTTTSGNNNIIIGTVNAVAAGTSATINIGGIITSTGTAAPATSLTAVAGILGTVGTTVAGLPTCNGTATGYRAYVTDALAPSFLTILVGGGSVIAPAFCNGTNWIAN